MAPEQLDVTFAALADPTRRAIIARLASGEATVTDLAEPFAMSLPAISKHLKVLERAGLISRGRDAQRRPCRLESARLKDVADWVEVYRRHWEASFDRLELYLRQVQANPSEPPTSPPPRPSSRSAPAAARGRRAADRRRPR